METKTEAKILSGFMEPCQQSKFCLINIATIKETYEEFGYVPLESPMVEYLNVLLAKIGEDTKKKYIDFKETMMIYLSDLTLLFPSSLCGHEWAKTLPFPFAVTRLAKFLEERGHKKVGIESFINAI